MSLRILWLCSWYPSRTSPFDGDFIQRHALAASAKVKIHVIHLVGDAHHTGTPETEYRQQNDNLTEEIVYYKKAVGPFSKIMNFLRWKSIYKKTISRWIQQQGIPDLVHVHIPYRDGLMALWLKKKFGLPYLVTEHWGIYNDRVEDRLDKRSPLFRYLLKKVFNHAECLVSVSRYLARQINDKATRIPYVIIPNVVDTRFFYPIEKKEDTVFRFIHVSNMAPLKNTEGILNAFALLFKEKKNTQLVIAGPPSPSVLKKIKESGLPDESVLLTGEIPYTQVAHEMQKADCLVLFSHIENSPCVLHEALCCGLPVIATSVGGIPEWISDENGILVNPDDEWQLKQAMIKMMENYPQFSREQIAHRATERFQYDTIGRLLEELYHHILEKNKKG
ncbi:MAG: glycosyltransferase [Chitinophagaceae bacterium]|nr:glycosyltransferase [Chitinophagaceae bacterium]